MKRHNGLILIPILLISFTTFLIGQTGSAENDSPPPNIIIMMADDMGMGDTSAFQFFTGNSDHEQIHTPAMEKLANMGMVFTDAHTPSTRCTPTRYSLLTGRYAWRNRIKQFVLFGSQGDPMIERDRPTIGTLAQSTGYRTGVVGKWHVGLRYRRSDGSPAAGWEDADLTQPLIDCPLDHGFDYARYTSRSHGTSGPAVDSKPERNTPGQSVGPGHLHGRQAIAAFGNGKMLATEGFNAYNLSKLGSRHLGHAMEFLKSHTHGGEQASQPFLLYYPSNSNHGPYTPDSTILGTQVADAARSVSGHPMDVRSDYIYENDVVLGHLIQFLEATPDPRNPGHNLVDNTLVIFTSDNGAEKNAPFATGSLRSNKASCYEGGHRVPFIASWPRGNVGDGNPKTPGARSRALIGLQDLFATISEILDLPLPDLKNGQKGGEDSHSFLSALKGATSARQLTLVNDHKQSKDPAVVAIRMDNPTFDERDYPGEWKLFIDAGLLRTGSGKPFELYNLKDDLKEERNLIDRADLKDLVAGIMRTASKIRLTGSERIAASTSLSFRSLIAFSSRDNPTQTGNSSQLKFKKQDLEVTLSGWPESGNPGRGDHFSIVPGSGLGFTSGNSGTPGFENGEAVDIQFNRDVIINYVAVKAGNSGTCGGYYQIGNQAPMAVYCVDADNDSNDQTGVLGDLGYIPAGTIVRISSSNHWQNEAAGQWTIEGISYSPVH